MCGTPSFFRQQDGLGALAGTRRTEQYKLSLEEPFVISIHQLAFDLLHGGPSPRSTMISTAVPAEREVLGTTGIADIEEQVRQHGHETEVDRAGEG